MNQGVCLLDEALNLARLEMAALEDGAYDRAVELAERRGEVTSMAWHMLEDSQADQYRTHLIELARVQDQLTELATRAHSEIRSQLQRSRLESRRMGDTFAQRSTNLSQKVQPFMEEARRLLVLLNTYKNWPNPVEAVSRRITATVLDLRKVLDPVLVARSEAQALLERVGYLADSMAVDTLVV